MDVRLRSLAWGMAAVCALAGAAPAAGPPAKLGAALRQRLATSGADAQIAVGVVLRRADLPAPGALRSARVAARQQRALDALPAGSAALRRRYRSLSGFAARLRPVAIQALERNPEVLAVYLDRPVHAALAQGVSLVGADAVHAQGLTGSGVTVAVLDSGIDTDHPDLQADIVAQHCFCDDAPGPTGCCPGNVGESTSAEDDEGHGTAVAGIIGSDGVAAAPGVAPDAGIVAVKVLDADGSGSFSDVAAALDWVLTESAVPGGPVEGVRVVNLSLSDGGEYDDDTGPDCAGTNTANAIQALHAAGIVVFAASGNDGHDAGVSAPACVAEAIAVGGVYDGAVGPVSWCGNASCSQILCTDDPTSADLFVCHTNSGSLLDLLAPDYRTRTSALGGGSANFGGTSAASPYAAGQAALLFQQDPTLTPVAVRALLTAHGPQVANPDNGLAFPRSDVAAALAEVLGASQLVLTEPGADFPAGGITTLSVQVQDGNGTPMNDDDATRVTFTPTGSAAVASVVSGSGDGGYGVPGGAETLTVSGGVASVALGDLVAETFEVAFANDAGLADPANDSISVTAGAATQVVLAAAGEDFAAGSGTSVSLEVRDGHGNLVTDDINTQLSFSPGGSASVAGVSLGSGDGSYGVPGAAESVTVSGGAATVTLGDLVAETFALGFANSAGLADPPGDSVRVTPGDAAQLVLSVPAADFEAGGSSALGVEVHDAYGNLVSADSITVVTFSPTGSARIAGVDVGGGDSSYGVPGAAETVTVAGGIAAVALEDPVAEVFEVVFSNDAGLVDPPNDSIRVTGGLGGAGSELGPPLVPALGLPGRVALVGGLLLAAFAAGRLFPRRP